MEGPTPVSALLHSATLVVAGVFVLIKLVRVYSFYCCCSCLFFAYIGLSCLDVKKVVAYSTCCQVSLLMLISLFQPVSIDIVYLIGHALYKSLIFVFAGVYAHAVGSQDIRVLVVNSKYYSVDLLTCSLLPLSIVHNCKSVVLLSLSLCDHVALSSFQEISSSLVSCELTSCYNLYLSAKHSSRDCISSFQQQRSCCWNELMYSISQQLRCCEIEYIITIHCLSTSCSNSE